MECQELRSPHLLYMVYQQCLKYTKKLLDRYSIKATIQEYLLKNLNFSRASFELLHTPVGSSHALELQWGLRRKIPALSMNWLTCENLDAQFQTAISHPLHRHRLLKVMSTNIIAQGLNLSLYEVSRHHQHQQDFQFVAMKKAISPCEKGGGRAYSSSRMIQIRKPSGQSK